MKKSVARSLEPDPALGATPARAKYLRPPMVANDLVDLGREVAASLGGAGVTAADARVVVEAMRVLGRFVGRFALDELRRVDMLPQKGSRLGSRIHRQEVKDRIKDGLGGAMIYRGEDYLLSREAEGEAFARGGPRRAAPPSDGGAALKKPTGSESAELARLRLKLDAELGAASRGPRRKGH